MTEDAEPAVSTRRGSSPLGRRFWTAWMAGTISNLGDGVVIAALPLLAARLTDEPLGIAATTIAVRLPWLVFGLFAGVVADRVDRLRLMIATDAIRAAAFIGLAVLVAHDRASLPVVYGIVFGVGILETLFDSAAMSVTPALVPASRLDQANARIGSGQLVANEFAGPALGAALFAAGMWLPFGVDAATFLASAIMLATIPGRYRPERSTPTRVSIDLRTGIGFIWREPVIRAFALGAAAINLGFTAATATLILYVRDVLDGGSFEFAALLLAPAVGGVATVLAAPRLIDRWGRRPAVLAAVAAMAIAVAAAGAASSWWLAAVALAVFGAAGEVWNVVSIGYRQRATPDELLGRVMAGFRVIAYGAFPVGAAVGGLAARVDLRAGFVVGAVMIAAAIPLLMIATRSMTER